MTERERKTLKFAFIIFLIIIISALIYTLISKIETNKYAIIKETLILEKTHKNWKQIYKPTEKILNQKYTVYTNNQTAKDTRLQYATSKWHYFDNNYKDLNLKNVRLATNIKNLKLANYQTSNYDNSDYEILSTALKKSGITNINSFIQKTVKTTGDFDNDGTKETIYTTTNNSLSITDEETQISKIFMTKNGKITQEIATSKTSPFFVIEIIDIDNDDNYELIISTNAIDVKDFSTCYQIYKLKNNHWSLQKDCQ